MRIVNSCSKNLEDGRQNEPEVFGKSITDPCLGWDNTAQLVHEIYDTLGK